MENKKIIFEGQATFSKKVLKEFVWALFKQHLFIVSLFSFFLVFFGVVDFIENGFNDIVAISIIIGILLPLIILINYTCQSKLVYAQCLERNDMTEPFIKVQFLDDKIILENLQKGNTETYPFTIIKRVVESKNLIICTTKAKINVIVEKSTLKYGSKDELLAFVKSKIQSK